MSALQKPIFTEKEYLALEAVSERKHEFYRGEIIAMAGASFRHELIITNSIRSVGNQLRGSPCLILGSDLRVKVASVKGYFYPDIKIVCGTAQFNDDKPQSLLNPTVIIEVLSPTTANFDQGEKFRAYRQIESLQEYVLIAQDTPHIERHIRQPDGGWVMHEFDTLDASLELPSVGCTLSLAEVYERVTFEDEMG